MLHLLYGPAASGKTDLLMGRIRTAVAARTPGQVLLVPEQYSHEAERALCAACGDSLSLYAEVLSFTGLARRVAAETGAGEAPLLDQGGRLLCMALALSQVAPRAAAVRRGRPPAADAADAPRRGRRAQDRVRHAQRARGHGRALPRLSGRQAARPCARARGV